MGFRGRQIRPASTACTRGDPRTAIGSHFPHQPPSASSPRDAVSADNFPRRRLRRHLPATPSPPTSPRGSPSSAKAMDPGDVELTRRQRRNRKYRRNAAGRRPPPQETLVDKPTPPKKIRGRGRLHQAPVPLTPVPRALATTADLPAASTSALKAPAAASTSALELSELVGGGMMENSVPKFPK